MGLKTRARHRSLAARRGARGAPRLRVFPSRPLPPAAAVSGAGGCVGLRLQSTHLIGSPDGRYGGLAEAGRRSAPSRRGEESRKGSNPLSPPLPPLYLICRSLRFVGSVLEIPRGPVELTLPGKLRNSWTRERLRDARVLQLKKPPAPTGGFSLRPLIRPTGSACQCASCPPAFFQASSPPSMW
jgi:hypothetical protein